MRGDTLTGDSNENENLIIPDTPNPSPNGYELTLLKFCHKNVAKCYGCSGNFFENGYPAVPFNLGGRIKNKKRLCRPKNTSKNKISRFYKSLLPFSFRMLVKTQQFLRTTVNLHTTCNQRALISDTQRFSEFTVSYSLRTV